MDFGGDGSLLTPAGCDAESARLTSIRLAKSALRRNIPKAVLRDVLEACGLAEPVGSGLGIPRDSYGRLRTDMVSSPAPDTEDTAETEPEVVSAPSGRHGKNGMCASGRHPWIPENIRPATETNTARCRPCEQRRKKGGSTKAPKDPDAPVLCRCPGRKHLLTSYTSETTYVDPRGKRQCRVGMKRQRQSEGSEAA